MRKKIRSLRKLDESGSAAVYEIEDEYALQLLCYKISYNNIEIIR